MKKQILVSLAATILTQNLWAQNSCNDTNRVRLMAVGDIIFHGALHQQSLIEGHGFRALWEPVIPLMNQASLRYGNLEGPSAPKVNSAGKDVPQASEKYVSDEGIYVPNTPGKTLSFNFHPDSVKDLKETGFDIFSTANNHSNDRRVLGIQRTLQVLDQYGIQRYGTSTTGSRRDFETIIDHNGVRLGFIGCTYGIQGGGGAEAAPYVSFCFQNGSQPNQKLIEQIAALNNQVDLVIFTPHWGTEYSTAINAAQKNLAKAAQKAGARLILGSHPHVVQPVEVEKDSRGLIKNFVAYSLANFVTNQMPSDYKDREKHEKQFPQRGSFMAFLDIQKVDGEVLIAAPKLVPVYMTPRHQNKKKIRQLVPAYAELYPNQNALVSDIKKTRELISSVVGDEYFLSSDQSKDIFECGR